MPDETQSKMHKLELAVTQLKTEVKSIGAKIDDMKETIKELAVVAKQQIQLSAKINGLEDYHRKVDALFKKLDYMQDKITANSLAISELKTFKQNLENRTWDLVKPVIIAIIMGALGFIVGHGKF